MIPLPFQKEEIKDTTKTVSSASFLDTYCTFDTNSQLSTRWYDKRDDFNFAIINFLQLDSNISTALAYGVYNSQLLRYARSWSLYSDFFITSPSSDYQTIISSVLKNHLIISFLCLSTDNTLFESIPTLACRLRRMVFAIIIGFEVDCCFTIKSALCNITILYIWQLLCYRY